MPDVPFFDRPTSNRGRVTGNLTEAVESTPSPSVFLTYIEQPHMPYVHHRSFSRITTTTCPPTPLEGPPVRPRSLGACPRNAGSIHISVTLSSLFYTFFILLNLPIGIQTISSLLSTIFLSITFRTSFTQFSPLATFISSASVTTSSPKAQFLLSLPPRIRQRRRGAHGGLSRLSAQALPGRSRGGSSAARGGALLGDASRLLAAALLTPPSSRSYVRSRPPGWTSISNSASVYTWPSHAFSIRFRSAHYRILPVDDPTCRPVPRTGRARAPARPIP